MLKDFWWFILYRVVLDICCVFLMSSGYGRGIVPEVDFSMVALSYGMAAGMIMLAISTSKRKASYYIYILLLSIVLPLTSLYCFMYPFHMYLGFVCLSFCVLWGTVFFPFRIKRFPFSFSTRHLLFIRKGILLLFFLFLTLILVRYFLLFGTNMFNLDMNKVYQYRFVLKERWNSGLWGYFQAWAFSIFLPILTVYFLTKKRTAAVLCMLGFHVLFYGLSSHKSVLFSGFFLVTLYFILEGKERPWRWFPFFSALGTVGLVFFLWFFETPFFKIIRGVVWRVFFIPSQVNFWYFDYFSQNGFAYFAHSFMRHFGAVSKYVPGPEYIIGEVYAGRIEIQANTGFLGSGYMEGGFLMMLIYSVIIGLLIRHFDKYATEENRNPVFAITTYPLLLVFTSIDLPAGIITGGIWILFITLPFLFSKRLYSGES